MRDFITSFVKNVIAKVSYTYQRGQSQLILPLSNNRLLHFTRWVITTCYIRQEKIKAKLPKMYYTIVQKRYDKTAKKISIKVKAKKPLVVGFYVMTASIFSALTVFEKMLDDDFFDPYIVIVPCTTRDKDFMIKTINESSTHFIKLYGSSRVKLGYNIEKNTLHDYSSLFDIVNFSYFPYMSTHKYFTLNYVRRKRILTFYTNYAFLSKLTYDITLIRNPSMSLFWRVFVDNEYSLKDFHKYQLIKGANSYLTGCCKIDNFAKYTKKDYQHKRIIIAPHHSILGDNQPIKMYDIKLSNFLSYADLFIELPTRYPEIDFIFRPHPFLYPTLAREDAWGQEKTQWYFEKITSFPNVIYSKEADFYEIFLNSDAIIHDCGSFLVEYLITGNPCCYMLKDTESIGALFTDFGIECLNHYYKAYTSDDIIHFIEKIVIKVNDNKRAEREDFANKHIKLNHPNVAQIIINDMKKTFQFHAGGNSDG